MKPQQHNSRILIDTHVLAWLLVGARLSNEAREAVESAGEDGLAIAGTTLWELAMMVQRKRVVFSVPLADVLRQAEAMCEVLPLTSAIAERSVGFGSRYPKDPADRIIGATALVHGLKLVTADEPILGSGEVPCIWQPVVTS